jgi:hypothetical protein
MVFAPIVDAQLQVDFRRCCGDWFPFRHVLAKPVQGKNKGVALVYFDLAQGNPKTAVSWDQVMERFVHRQNIEHFQELLKTTADTARREKIMKLLAEEKAALKKAEDKYREKK